MLGNRMCPRCKSDLQIVGVHCDGNAAYFATVDDSGKLGNVTEVEVKDTRQAYCRNCDANVNQVLNWKA